MSDVFDYLAWRSDLTFEQAPLNEIDGLIFSRLSYLQLDKIVGHAFDKPITLALCCEKYFKTTTLAKQKNDERLLKTLAKLPRYREILISGFKNEINPSAEQQFCALTFSWQDQHVVAYRGTDDTLIGLKEDFNMSFMPTVPCQITGLKYFTHATQALKGDFYLVGHSKGGNIALFSALFCSENTFSHLKHVYSFDGPGFSQEILRKADFKKLKPLISAYIPQSSIIGLLLTHLENYTIVHSNQTSIMQHDLYSWEICAPHGFLLETSLETSSLFIDQTLKDWLNLVSPDKRKAFINVVFEVLNATEATSLQELTAKKLTTAKTLLTHSTKLDKKQRQLILNLLSSLVQTSIKNRSFLN